MATNPSYTILAEAYYKLFFHAAKHPHKPVNGILLGRQEPQGNSVTIIDTVPLLHHWTSLSPMMEIGLDLVRFNYPSRLQFMADRLSLGVRKATQHAESEGLKVVGYYQACERLDETALAPVGEKVAGRIRTRFEDAIAFVVRRSSCVVLGSLNFLRSTDRWTKIGWWRSCFSGVFEFLDYKKGV